MVGPLFAPFALADLPVSLVLDLLALPALPIEPGHQERHECPPAVTPPG